MFGCGLSAKGYFDKAFAAIVAVVMLVDFCSYPKTVGVTENLFVTVGFTATGK